MTSEPSRPSDLDRWTEAGIITADQADRMRADVTRPTTRGPSLVMEAFGYLGGVIVLAGLSLATSQYLRDLDATARTELAVVIALVLAGAGAAARQRPTPALTRLRAVLWAMSAVALFVGLTLAAADPLDLHGYRLVLFAATGTGLAAGLMWWISRRPTQHAVFFVCLLLAAEGTADLVSSRSSSLALAAGVVGAAWTVLALAGIVRPRPLGLCLGAAAIISACLGLVDEPWGPVVSLVALVALVGLAVAVRDLVVLAVVSVGTMVVLPRVVLREMHGELAPGLTLVAVGLLLVAIAVFTARRRRG
jgi:hypothetical protein